MKSIAEMSQIELTAFVQTNLERSGIKVVLSGGAATSFYCLNKYVSHDIDLVNIYSISRKRVFVAMKSLGFSEVERYFKHPESQFFVEFPPGPLTVGLEPVKQVDEVQLPTGVLKVISPTDCVKDRLAAFYHWGDEQALQQAKWVRDTVKVDLEEIKRWSVHEGKLAEYKRFLVEK